VAWAKYLQAAGSPFATAVIALRQTVFAEAASDWRPLPRLVPPPQPASMMVTANAAITLRGTFVIFTRRR